MGNSTEDIKLIINKIKSVIAPSRIILFGSQSNGQAKPDSDYDICVLVDVEKGHRSISHQLYREFVTFSKPIDFIVLSEKKFTELLNNPSMIYKDIAGGKLIYDRIADSSSQVA